MYFHSKSILTQLNLLNYKSQEYYRLYTWRLIGHIIVIKTAIFKAKNILCVRLALKPRIQLGLRIIDKVIIEF